MSDLPYVSVQPGMKFGEPCIRGHRLPTELIGDLVEIEGHESVMREYDLTREEVLVACWFEARYGRRKRRKAWKAWEEKNFPLLWETRPETWAKVPFPGEMGSETGVRPEPDSPAEAE